MRQAFILMAMLLIAVAGCGRGEEPVPSSGVESGELPPAEGTDGTAGATPPTNNPANTVPSESQEEPSRAPSKEAPKQETPSPSKRPDPKKETPKQSGGSGIDANLVSKGKAKFGEVGCVNCHAIGGEGSKTGPDLARVGAEHPDVQFYLDLLNDPMKMGKKGMPSFAHLAAEDLRALAEYLRSLR